MDLLDSPGSRTLQGDNVTLSWKQVLVFQFFHGDSSWVLDKTAQIDKEIVFINVRNTTMIPDKMIFIPCDWRLDETILQLLKSPYYWLIVTYPRRLSIVREL